MFQKITLLLILANVSKLLADMEGFIVGGQYAQISNHPHSVYLAISCKVHNSAMNWICGSSILNQYFTLTAGHCLEDCNRAGYISTVVGNENIHKGYKSSATNFRIHERYNSHTLQNDIAIVRMKTPLRLNARVKRVVIQRHPDFSQTADIAGWGLIDENKGILTQRLKSVEQKLWTRHECIQALGHIPIGCICAGARKSPEFAAEGDSGSALMIRGYIQVGLVSFKMPTISQSLSVYTDVGYFYDWISTNTRQMFCYYK